MTNMHWYSLISEHFIELLFICFTLIYVYILFYNHYRFELLEMKAGFLSFLWFFENPGILIITMTLLPLLILWGYVPQEWAGYNLLFTCFNLGWVVVGLLHNLRFTPYLIITTIIGICLFYNQLNPALGVGILGLLFLEGYENSLQFYISTNQLNNSFKLKDDLRYKINVFNSFVFKQTLFFTAATLYICIVTPELETRHASIHTIISLLLLFYFMPFFILGKRHFIGKLHYLMLNLNIPTHFMPWLQRRMVLWTVHGFKYRPINSEET